MSLSYTLKESIEGFRRAKASSLLSIATISFLLVLIGIFLVITVNIQRLIAVVHANIDLEVFIDETIDDSDISRLEKELKSISGISKVEFISKTAAAKIFQQEIGEDFIDILEENPLPCSFKIDLAPEHRSADTARSVVNQIEELPGVNEVVYRRIVLELLEKYAKLAIEVDITLGVLVGLGSLLIVSNTIRLIILAKRNILAAMKLVGATRWFIRSPFVIEGGIQGVFGGFIAAGFINLAIKVLSLEIPAFLIVNTQIYYLLIILGLILGIVGSLIATYKFID